MSLVKKHEGADVADDEDEDALDDQSRADSKPAAKTPRRKQIAAKALATKNSETKGPAVRKHKMTKAEKMKLKLHQGRQYEMRFVCEKGRDKFTWHGCRVLFQIEVSSDLWYRVR